MQVLYLILLIVLLLLVYRVGFKRGVSKQVPQPQPKPKKFGLVAVESVKKALGGLSVEQAQAARVAASVCEMEFTLKDELEGARGELTASINEERSNIGHYKQQIVYAEAKIEEAEARKTEVNDLAKAFGL